MNRLPAPAHPPAHSPPERLERLQCQPGHCRGHPDCVRQHCNGHPVYDTTEDEFDHNARARFWRAYLLGLALTGLLVLLWFSR